MRSILLLYAGLIICFTASPAQAKWTKEKCAGYNTDITALTNFVRKINPNVSVKHRKAHSRANTMLKKAKKERAANC